MALDARPGRTAAVAVSFDAIRSATDDFRDCIGHGATGRVYRGTLLRLAVAVKRFRLPVGASPEQRAAVKKNFNAEVRVNDSLTHPRLVRLHAYAIDDTPEAENPFALVYDRMEGGSLADWLRGPNDEPPARSTRADKDAAADVSAAVGAAGGAPCSLSALLRTDMALGIAAGLGYLHGQEEAAGDGPGVAGAAGGAGAGGRCR